MQECLARLKDVEAPKSGYGTVVLSFEFNYQNGKLGDTYCDVRERDRFDREAEKVDSNARF